MKMKRILKKKILKFERSFEVETGPEEYFVILRKQANWFADQIGLSLGKVIRGEPSDADCYSVWSNNITGPFETEQEAEDFLKKELEEMRKEDPERFSQLSSLQKLIRPEPEEVKK